MSTNNFERSVFVNCPFDEDYEPILQAILFCILYFGFTPRIATERADSSETRLSKILKLIEASKYSIHDLSRCQSIEAGELYRMNMPFELGLDHGCLSFGPKRFSGKRILILEEQKYRYQASLSDLAGCDIEAHSANFELAVRKVRNWLCEIPGTEKVGASEVLTRYVAFQEWHYEGQLENGFAEADIQDYPTSELLDSMTNWFKK